MVLTSASTASRASRRVHGSRTCSECGAELPERSSVNRVLCDRCRGRRRGITFLKKAAEVLVESGFHLEAGEAEVLVGNLERVR